MKLKSRCYTFKFFWWAAAFASVSSAVGAAVDSQRSHSNINTNGTKMKKKNE